MDVPDCVLYLPLKHSNSLVYNIFILIKSSAFKDFFVSANSDDVGPVKMLGFTKACLGLHFLLK